MDGADERSCRENPSEKGRLYRSSALLSRLGTDLVRERARRDAAHAGPDRSARHRPFPCKRSRREHAGISESLRLQSRAADGARPEFVQSLVIAAQMIAGAKNRMANTQTLIREVYSAFNQRNIDRALAFMSESVSWPKASEGGRVIGKEEIRSYWRRQWKEFD